MITRNQLIILFGQYEIMNIEKYFINLTNELSALKDRVRHYIDDAHWLSDGEWKESVIRTILRRHLPTNIGVGRGFIVKTEQASTQIDVLLYDKTKPILFQDGDFIIITPDTVRGIIEVKTKIRQKGDLEKALNKLSEINQFLNPTASYDDTRFLGLFSYEKPPFNLDTILETLQDCVNGQHQRTINCISLGENFFVRYWPKEPNTPGLNPYNRWHSYNLENKAPAYFIHNVVDHLCPQWTSDNINVWYPENGKEDYKISDIFFYKAEQIAQVKTSEGSALEA